MSQLNIPGGAGLINTLPAVQQAGAYPNSNRIPEIIQAIMQDRRQGQEIKSRERMSQNELMQRANQVQQQIAMEGQKLGLGQQEMQMKAQQEELNRQNQLEQIHQQGVERLKDTSLKYFGITDGNIGQILGQGGDSSAPSGAVTPGGIKEAINNNEFKDKFKGFVNNFDKDIQDFYSEKLPINELEKKWGGQSGIYFSEKMDKARQVANDRIRFAKTTTDNATKVSDELASGKEIDQIAKDHPNFTADDLTLGSKINAASGKDTIGVDKANVSKYSKGDLKPGEEFSFATSVNNLEKAGFKVDQDAKDARDAIANKGISKIANDVINVEQKVKGGTPELRVGEINSIAAQAKNLDGKSSRYFNEVYEPLRKKLETDIPASIDKSNIEDTINKFKILNKFENKYSNGDTVSIPDIVRLLPAAPGSGFGYRVKSFARGSQAEANRVYDEIKNGLK